MLAGGKYRQLKECCKIMIFMIRTPRHISLLTNLLTPWSRVLLEKITGSAASQERHVLLSYLNQIILYRQRRR